VLYFSTLRTPGSRAVLESSLASLLASLETEKPAPVHFQLYYEQVIPTAGFRQEGKVFEFAATSPSLAFDDATLGPVKEVWRLVVGSVTEEEEAGYMKFQDREGVGEDDVDYD